MPPYNILVEASWLPINNPLPLTVNEASMHGVTRYWGTFYHPSFSYKLPDGTQAFYMKDDYALYRVGADGSVIPANTPVVIMSEKAAVSLTPCDNDHGISVSGNILKGTSVQTKISAATIYYVMNKDANGNL